MIPSGEKIPHWVALERAIKTLSLRDRLVEQLPELRAQSRVQLQQVEGEVVHMFPDAGLVRVGASGVGLKVADELGSTGDSPAGLGVPKSWKSPKASEITAAIESKTWTKYSYFGFQI
jgi:hypothetical protein